MAAAIYPRILALINRMRVAIGLFVAVITVYGFANLLEDDSDSRFGGNNLDSPSAGNSSSESKLVRTNFKSDTVYYVPFNGKLVRVEIKVSNYVGSTIPRKMLLLLPGWNFADTQWCTRTRVCEEASKKGFDVMLVEMGKSVYMDSVYPQMRADYRLFPTRIWLWDSVLQPLQSRGSFTDQGIPEDPIETATGKVLYQSLELPIPSFVMGLSTGARGALLLALEHPEAFKGCAGLSGDYNPLLMTNDNLMINCLGKYEAFPWRWRGMNNIQLRVDSMAVPMYLAHGMADKVVGSNQTESLIKALESSKQFQLRASNHTKTHKNSSLVRYKMTKDAGHDYAFWNVAGLQALDYFNTLIID